MSLFSPRRSAGITASAPQVQAQNPVETPSRSASETAALAAEQTRRYTRRRGRASSILSNPESTSGGMSAARMLGSVART